MLRLNLSGNKPHLATPPVFATRFCKRSQFLIVVDGSKPSQPPEINPLSWRTHARRHKDEPTGAWWYDPFLRAADSLGFPSTGPGQSQPPDGGMAGQLLRYSFRRQSAFQPGRETFVNTRPSPAYHAGQDGRRYGHCLHGSLQLGKLRGRSPWAMRAFGELLTRPRAALTRVLCRAQLHEWTADSHKVSGVNSGWSDCYPPPVALVPMIQVQTTEARKWEARPAGDIPSTCRSLASGSTHRYGQPEWTFCLRIATANSNTAVR